MGKNDNRQVGLEPRLKELEDNFAKATQIYDGNAGQLRLIGIAVELLLAKVGISHEEFTAAVQAKIVEETARLNKPVSPVEAVPES